MALRVVMFSTTPLAGAPIRIAQAINRHTDIQVRVVDLKRWGIYDHDHVHEENPEQTLALVERADIIHLFNYLDAGSKDFAPVDFAAVEKKGARLIRMFGSTPMLVAQHMGLRLEQVLDDPIPKLVIAQHPERFLPAARVVPNIIPQDAPEYTPAANTSATTRNIVYSPTRRRSAWESRWDTKGMPETMSALNEVRRQVGCEIRLVHNRPLEEVLRVKRDATLVVDDMVTGSYHLSGLEGLSLGKPVIAFLDDRIQFVLRTISGSDLCPFVTTRLEDAVEVATYLLRDDVARDEIARDGRAWIEKNWNDKNLVRHYQEAYRLLLDDPSKVCRQAELTVGNGVRRFQALSLPDLVYEARRERWQRAELMSERLRPKRGIRERAVSIALRAGRSLPPSLKRPLKRIFRRDTNAPKP